MKRIFSAICAAALVCVSSAGTAASYQKNSEGLYVDSSGSVIEDYWDDDAGIYIVNGVGYSITNEDGGSSSSGADSSASSGAITVNSSDGAEDPTAGLQKNADGSVTIQSGQISAPDSSEGTGQHLTQEEWAARWAKYSAKNGTTTGTVYMDESGEVYPAEIKYLGLACSTIIVEGEELRVPTASLKWDTEAPAEKVLAVVTPSSQSYLTIRAKSSKKAFVMEQCQKCKVLRVIRTGKTWSFVDDSGIRGYVLTSGLTFYDNAPRSYASGIITVKGKTPRGNYVHYRSAPSNKAMQSKVEYPVGTEIAVLSQEGDWSEIDLAGFHCYMQSKFVTLKEPLILADASAQAEPEPGLAPLEP